MCKIRSCSGARRRRPVMASGTDATRTGAIEAGAAGARARLHHSSLYIFRKATRRPRRIFWEAFQRPTPMVMKKQGARTSQRRARRGAAPAGGADGAVVGRRIALGVGPAQLAHVAQLARRRAVRPHHQLCAYAPVGPRVSSCDLARSRLPGGGAAHVRQLRDEGVLVPDRRRA